MNPEVNDIWVNSDNHTYVKIKRVTPTLITVDNLTNGQEQKIPIRV